MRPGAARSHLEEADLVDLRDTAAPRADLDQLDGGDADGEAAALDEAALSRRLEAVRRQRLAAVNERELGGGAAHVEGQNARRTSPGGEAGGCRALPRAERGTTAVVAAEERGGDGPR